MAGHFNMMRTYDPPTGRYLEVDPLAISARSPYEYAWSNPLRFVDPLGLIEKNFFPPGSAQHKYASEIPSGGLTYGVGGHGDPEAIDDGAGNPITPEDLANEIADDSSWGGRPISLYSCNTGRGGDDSFAQKLADALGVIVMAPTNISWLPGDFVGPAIGGECCETDLHSECCKAVLDPENAPRPDRENPGRWKVFKPRPTSSSGAHP